jgi:hypothetical protein
MQYFKIKKNTPVLSQRSSDVVEIKVIALHGTSRVPRILSNKISLLEVGDTSSWRRVSTTCYSLISVNLSSFDAHSPGQLREKNGCIEVELTNEVSNRYGEKSNLLFKVIG